MFISESSICRESHTSTIHQFISWVKNQEIGATKGRRAGGGRGVERRAAARVGPVRRRARREQREEPGAVAWDFLIFL